MIGLGRASCRSRFNTKAKGLLLAQQTPSQKGGHPMIEWFPIIGYALILAYYVHHNVMH